MQKALLDAGPLIALFDNSDKHSLRVQDFFKTYKGSFYTTWPVITETMHFLNFNAEVQSDFLKWLQRDPLRISTQDKKSLEKIRILILKYQNVPMDFADASLLLLSEEENINHILTLDSDYIVYRSKKKKFKYLL
ncbi:MAG: PIN domain-containing protein [Leptospiraceae bacterium]|nr:PIN domain-containing protein [Leptospiraceae bacterium]